MDRRRLKNRFKLYPHWKYDKEGNTMCGICYYRKYPTVWKKESDKNNFLWFGKKVRYVPRIVNNQCSICGRKKGENVEMISMHHEAYITCLPWFGRVEMCQSCHAKIPKQIPYATMIRMKTRKGKRYCIIIGTTYKRKYKKRLVYATQS